MNSNWIFLVYYIFAIIIVAIFSYAVFILNHSGWWFLLCGLIIDKTPTINKKDKKL